MEENVNLLGTYMVVGQKLKTKDLNPGCFLLVCCLRLFELGSRNLRQAYTTWFEDHH
jgi:hypothetical protein